MRPSDGKRWFSEDLLGELASLSSSRGNTVLAVIAWGVGLVIAALLASLLGGPWFVAIHAAEKNLGAAVASAPEQ